MYPRSVDISAGSRSDEEVPRVAATGFLLLAFALLAGQLGVIAFGSAAGGAEAEKGLATGAIAAAGLATLLTAAGSPPQSRFAWLSLGLGILSFAAGFAFLVYALALPPAFPGLPDFFWIAFYLFLLGAIGLLVRAQHRVGAAGITLDAAIIALALGSIGYELVFNGLIDVSEITAAVGGEIGYSMVSLAILVGLVLVCAPSRAAVGRAYPVLGLALLIGLATDVVFVHQEASGSYAPGTLLDAGWPAAMAVLALASRFGTGLERVSALRGGTLRVAILASFAVSFGLLLQESLHDRNPVVITLAALVQCLIVARLVFSVRESEQLASDNESIVAAAGEGIFRTDSGDRVVSANPAALAMLGYTLDEVLGRRSHELFHHTRPNGSPYPASECPVRKTFLEGATNRVADEVFWRRDGSSLAVDYTSAPVREHGHVTGVVVVFDDVTHQRQLRERLRVQADHDSLTGLFNRRRFAEELAEQLRYSQRYRRPGVLVLIDLDSFKLVNDSFGHPIGDKLLCDVAAVLTETVRETDVVARIGGDEFAVLLREASREEGLAIADGLVEAIRGGSEPSVGASAGVAPFDGDSRRSPDDLLVAADIALYEAKERGQRAPVLYTGQRGQALTWVQRIREALDEGRVAVDGQPIVDLGSGAVVREELLVRMLDEHGDRIPSAAFLPAAERFGLIGEIDLLVLERAVGLAAAGRAVAVNVSARTLANPAYLAALEEAIGAGLDPALLGFELTEAIAVAHMADAQAFAGRIRELGCNLALDDFGSGFSSFAYLKQIPAQYLKIDIELIRELRRDRGDQDLVRAIVAVARGLGQRTVAEGVEDEETLDVLRRLGVDLVQGFGLGAPVPAPAPSAPRRR